MATLRTYYYGDIMSFSCFYFISLLSLACLSASSVLGMDRPDPDTEEQSRASYIIILKKLASKAHPDRKFLLVDFSNTYTLDGLVINSPVYSKFFK